jgi:hypothetical protein
MALHASWVHGNAVRSEWVHDNLQNVSGGRWDQTGGDVPWSDVNGLPRGWGTTFRGRRAFTGGLGGTTTGPFDVENPFKYSQKGYWFHFAIPTPVVVAGGRATLEKVFVLWSSTEGVAPWAIHVWDGAERLPAIEVRAGRGGTSHSDELSPVTAFAVQPPRPVKYGIGISIAVGFEADGDITFHAAGADFEI